MKKKVLFVITKSNWGGAQRYVHDLALHLPRDMFDIAVATGGNGILIDKLTEQGVRVIRIPHLERDINIKNEIRSTLALWEIFKNENPDIIHLNSSKIGGLGGLVAYLARLYIRNKRWKIIFTVHGWAFNEDRSKIARSAIRIVQWITTVFCDWVIIISNRDFRQATHLPMVNRRKFVLIPLGIPEHTLAFLPKTEARAQLSSLINIKLAARMHIIGTIAELTGNKGLPHLIGAIHHLQNNDTVAKNMRVIIIGSGEDHIKLQNMITAYHLQDTIILAGFISNAAQYLRAFDIFALASLKEGLPYTLIETMHAHVPIVASRVGGIPDLIEHENNGIIVPAKNSGALAAAFEQLIADKRLRARFAKEGGKKVIAKFSFDAMLKHTIALYQQDV